MAEAVRIGNVLEVDRLVYDGLDPVLLVSGFNGQIEVKRTTRKSDEPLASMLKPF